MKVSHSTHVKKKYVSYSLKRMRSDRNLSGHTRAKVVKSTRVQVQFLNLHSLLKQVTFFSLIYCVKTVYFT